MRGNWLDKPVLIDNSSQCLYAHSKSTQISIKEVYTIMDRYEKMHKLTLKHKEKKGTTITTIFLENEQIGRTNGTIE